MSSNYLSKFCGSCSMALPKHDFTNAVQQSLNADAGPDMAPRPSGPSHEI